MDTQNENPDDPPLSGDSVNPTRDRLSELPDLAVVNIVSQMHLEEAARTTILSKRFNSLWHSVSSLTFSDQHSGKDGDVFISFVQSALGFHRRSTLEKFAVEFRYDPKYKEFVNGWIQFAAEKQVKSFCLNLVKNHGGGPHFRGFEFELPEFLYENKNLVELVTCLCKFSKNGRINWNSLKFLCIAQTKLNEGLISRVLCGCPVLETLELRDWRGFDRLKIESVSLRVLRIVAEKCPRYLGQPPPLPQDECLLEISGPNLVSLEVSGSLYRTKVRVNDVGSLVNAAMNFDVRPRGRIMPSWFVVMGQDIVREVLQCLCLVKNLTLGGWCIKALSTCEAYNLSSPWSDRRSLTLCIPVINWDHRGIASLLHSSPYLETLVIGLTYCSDKLQCMIEHTRTSHDSCDEGYYWKSWSTISKCPLPHLKTVKVVGLQVSCQSMKPLFEFLGFLLRNASVLQEIVIQATRYMTQGTLQEALELLAIHPASPDAVVHFEPPHLWVDPLFMYRETAPL